MTAVDPAGATPPAISAADEQRLRTVVRQMEGVFVNELLKAMRETVPEGEGVVAGGTGEEMFRGMLDEHLAEQVPGQWRHGLGAALYNQLRGALVRARTQGDTQ